MGKNQDAVDRATAAISKATTVEDGAKILIGSLRQAIKDNATDPAALSAALDAFDAKTTELSDALVENTPAADTGTSTT